MSRPDTEHDLLEGLVEAKEESVEREAHGEVARLDPLRRYLFDVSKFEPLAPEEEHRLALLYHQRKDPEAAYRLVTANLRLVVRIALLYNRIYQNALDLIQEGNVGLMEAVKRFDPYRGTRFPTYATWWIKAYIIRFILENFRIVKVGTTNARRKVLFNLRKEKERLLAQGIDPTPQLVARNLEVDEKDVIAVEQSLEGRDISLDEPVTQESDLYYLDMMASTEELVDEKLARRELRQLFDAKLQEFTAGLTEKERVILQERLMADDPRTLQDIATQYGVTREAIRVTEKKLVARIKEHMKDALKELRGVEFLVED
ncbi:MAG: RNA polymerase factor sigma-32 [Acidobacteria bacterium]|nr:RNA polymerase factor sigma-32 [Acidobacteriota bacterium]